MAVRNTHTNESSTNYLVFWQSFEEDEEQSKEFFDLGEAHDFYEYLSQEDMQHVSLVEYSETKTEDITVLHYQETEDE